MMKKISVYLSGHATSISLEPEFIDAMRKIAAAQNRTVAAILSEIDDSRSADDNLSSAVRVWVLKNIQK